MVILVDENGTISSERMDYLHRQEEEDFHRPAGGARMLEEE